MSKSYVVLCRHGQRAPGRLLDPGDVKRWEPWAIRHNGSSLPPSVHRHFPVFSHTCNSLPHDELHHPFGSLTSLGAVTMRSTGRKLAMRFPDLMGASHYVACATNYRRTQMSAQFLLQGVFDIASNNMSDVQGRILVEQGSHCPLSFYDSFPAVADALVRNVGSLRAL